MKPRKVLRNRLVDLAAQHLSSHDRLVRAFKDVVFDDRVLSKLVLDNRLVTHDRVVAAMELYKSWRVLSCVAQTDRTAIVQKYDAARAELLHEKDVQSILLDLICQGDEVFLTNGVMKFPDRWSLWTLISEILINEDYYFETNTDAPRILDCGTHFGLAVYYFKNLYPQARITGFEPVPELRQLALQNIRRNRYSDVEILPYALSNAVGTSRFIVSRADSMAGSLTDRRRMGGDDVTEIEVDCRLLSEFLQEPVHFLKLDVEGSEDIVLAEAEGKLANVQHVFCEYHHAAGLDTGRLGQILAILDTAGFDVHVGKSLSSQRRTRRRPMTYAHEAYSVSIWARNGRWEDRTVI